MGLQSHQQQNACTTQLQQTHHTQCQEGNSGSIRSNKNPCAANQLPMMCVITDLNANL
jgi:hypothetical protein